MFNFCTANVCLNVEVFTLMKLKLIAVLLRIAARDSHTSLDLGKNRIKYISH